MTVCIIILNYNGFSDTKECIESVLKHINGSICKVVVVDNGSNSNDLIRLRELCNKHSIIYLIETSNNRGYAGGNNIGIEFARARHFEYICILNNDTIVKSDFLTPCIEVLSSQKKIGFLGPAIIDYETNQIQSSGGEINVLRGRVDLINSGHNPNDILNKGLISCDYVGGACIICRTELIDRIGMIPEDYFLFYEETEWCYKALREGYKNFCITDCSIIHKGSQSTSQYSGLQEYLMARNRVVFVKRNMQSRAKFILFLIYLVFGNVKRIFKDKERFRPYFKYYLDGLTGRVDPRYPFVICKNEERL